VRIKKYAAAKAEDFTEYLPNYLSTQKEVELAKFHEEEGKKNCLCHDCQGRKEIRHQIKKSYDDY
jgi:hypothetical protein